MSNNDKDDFAWLDEMIKDKDDFAWLEGMIEDDPETQKAKDSEFAFHALAVVGSWGSAREEFVEKHGEPATLGQKKMLRAWCRAALRDLEDPLGCDSKQILGYMKTGCYFAEEFVAHFDSGCKTKLLPCDFYLLAAQLAYDPVEALSGAVRGAIESGIYTKTAFRKDLRELRNKTGARWKWEWK